MGLAFWTTERVATMKRMLEEGYPYSDIAKVVGATRSATIAKASRLKLAAINPRERRKPGPQAGFKRSHTAHGKASAPRPLGDELDALVELPSARRALPKRGVRRRRVRLTSEFHDDTYFYTWVDGLKPRSSSDITDIPGTFSCKWITGDVKEGNARWCRHPIVHNSSWCGDHFKRVKISLSAYRGHKPSSELRNGKQK